MIALAAESVAAQLLQLAGEALIDHVFDRLRAANPAWTARATAVNPDGDVDLPERDLEAFRPVDCAVCGGVLKPDVVFFGETVPRDRVDQAYALVDAADVLVVLGSSLTVMSGFRFVRHNAKAGRDVIIVNRGTTRGDDLATLKLEAGVTETLAGLRDAFSA